MTKLRTLLLILIGWVLVALVSSALPGVEILQGGKIRHIGFTDSFVENLLTYMRWALIAPAIIYTVRAIAVSNVSRTQRIALHLASALGFILVIYMLNLVDLPVQRYHMARSWSGFFGQLPRAVGMYGIIAALTLAYATHRRLLQRETQLVEARLQALAAQLHPHFLSNALNGIAALVDTRPAEARSMIARLGELLRAAVDSTQHRETTLTHEIEWLERYLEVQQIRFEDRLDITLQISPEVVDAMVPPLILQPLVENAIKHGVESRTQGGRVTVHAEKRDGCLRLRVGNDAATDKLGTRAGGVGLRNVRARLQALYGTEQSVSITQRDDWVEAVVELPFHSLAAI